MSAYGFTLIKAILRPLKTSRGATLFHLSLSEINALIRILRSLSELPQALPPVIPCNPCIFLATYVCLTSQYTKSIRPAESLILPAPSASFPVPSVVHLTVCVLAFSSVQPLCKCTICFYLHIYGLVFYLFCNILLLFFKCVKNNLILNLKLSEIYVTIHSSSTPHAQNQPAKLAVAAVQLIILLMWL